MTSLPAPAILYLQIPDTRTLASTWIPMIRGGGLFLPTADRYSLGAELFLLLRLPNEEEVIAVTGTVVWIMPQSSTSGRGQLAHRQGIGIRFVEEDGTAKRKIQTALSGVAADELTTWMFPA